MEPDFADSPPVQLVQTPEAMDVEQQAPMIQDAGTALALVEPKEDDRFTGSYTWEFKDVSKAGEKTYSENFEIGTYMWRVLVFPKGNQRRPNLSVYLDSPETHVLPLSMCPRANFSITIVNQLDKAKTWTKEANHLFTAQESDWGFTETILLDDMNNPAAGWIVNDTMIIIVSVTVQKDEGYNSRKDTAFVGLKNQGATCYMNSLLQYLYNIPYFRKAVYHMPTSETDEPSKNMPLALQSLFFKLQYSRTTVSTKELTQSFGWNTADAFMQHDVQELNRVLCEKLEEKMKGTRVERVINDLFEGHTVNIIQCINVDYTSERKESYMDLQLDVKGCKDIYASFDKYTELETMDGANQYMAEGYGLQDARKGVLFQSFPPVLQLQLKRFEYDFQRDAMVKINDRYEFFDELDLDVDNGRYLAGSADRSIRNHYRLHAVLVHSGGVHGGHYYAFVRPDGQTWLRFDDERVTKESPQKAMDEQFGDDEAGVGLYGGQQPHLGGVRFPKHSNAYMLVYIRTDDWDRINCLVTKDDLSDALRARFEAELADKERRQQEKMEAHMYVSVKVATDRDIRDQINAGRAFDLVDHDLLPPDKGAFRVKKGMHFLEFKKHVERVMGVPLPKQRYWVWKARANGTLRAQSILEVPDDTPLIDLNSHTMRDKGPPTCKNALMDLKLYLETPRSDPDNWLAGDLFQREVGNANDAFVFCKLYDPRQEKLTYVGRAHLPQTCKFLEMADMFKRMAGLPDQLQVEVFEEVKPEPTLIVTQHKLDDTLNDCKPSLDGDIFIIQPLLPPDQAATLRLPSIQDYLHYVQQRRFVVFKPLVPEEGTGSSGPTAGGGGGGQAQLGPHEHKLELRDNMTYQEVTIALAAKLGLGPHPESGAALLRLTQHNQYTHSPQRQPLKNRQAATLQSMLAMGSAHLMPASRLHSGMALASDILYYEVLDMPLDQLEQLKTLKVYFHKESGDPASEHVVRLKRDAQVAALLAEVAKQLGQVVEGKELRLLETHSSKLYKMYSPGDSVEHLDDSYWQLRVEVVPPDESGLEFAASMTGERLLHCYHINYEKPVGPTLTPTPAQPTQAPMDISQQGSNSPVSQPGSGGLGGVLQGAPQGQQQPQQPAGNLVTFGDPVLVKCCLNDTLETIKARLQAKLGVSDEEFGKWQWCWCTAGRTGIEQLTDRDNVGQRAAKPCAAVIGNTDSPFLGMQHEDDKPRRIVSSRPTYERPVKIYT